MYTGLFNPLKHNHLEKEEESAPFSTSPLPPSNYLLSLCIIVCPGECQCFHFFHLSPDLETTGLPAGSLHLATRDLTHTEQKSIARQGACGKWRGDGLANVPPSGGTPQAAGRGPEDRNNSTHP